MNVQFIQLSSHKLAESLARQLHGSAAPALLFTTLRDKYSKDTSMAQFPDGRLIARGVKGAAFDAAYALLKDGAVSGVIAGGDGYYILQRLPITPNMAVDTGGVRLRYWAAYNQLFKPQIAAWCRALPIVYADAWKQIDVTQLLR
jgi:hypothetical protein